jgi:hypothetical protein
MRVAALGGLSLVLLPSCKPAVQPSGPPKPVAAKTNLLATATNRVPTAYVSVFEDLAPPKGRDPFFPNSRRREPEPTSTTPREKAAAVTELVLKGIVGSPNHRLAVINSTILEINEEASVRLPEGARVRVRCVEIGEDHALIKVEGELQPRRLVLNKKGF